MLASPLQSDDQTDKATADVFPSPRSAPAPVIAPSRLLIYHADLRLKVASLPRATTSLDSLVRRNGGYLTATEVRAEGEWRQAMTIQVAPTRFQPLRAALGGLVTVEEKS